MFFSSPPFYLRRGHFERFGEFWQKTARQKIGRRLHWEHRRAILPGNNSNPLEVEMFRNKLYSVLCAVLVLAFVAGCGSAPAQPTATATLQQPTATQIHPTPTLIPPTATPVVTDFVATKPEEIAGVWRFTVVGVPWFFNFYPDGKHFSNRVEGGKGINGTFWFDGSVFHFKDIGCSPDDIQQTEGTYEAHVIQHDGVNFKLYFNAIKDSCKDRANEMKRGYYWKGSLE